MNTDVRLYTGFWQHPKTKKMVKRLGLEAARSLQILWLFTAQNKSDGLLSGMDWEDIELAADWQGEEHAFFDYCLGVWIDETNQGYAIHDWEEHNPWQAEAAARSEQARQNAKAGWEKRRAKQPHANGNAENMQPHANGNAPFLTSPVNITPPYPPCRGANAICMHQGKRSRRKSRASYLSGIWVMNRDLWPNPAGVFPESSLKTLNVSGGILDFPAARPKRLTHGWTFRT